jgi:mRNA (guanine-N7-)-methyltransferase
MDNWDSIIKPITQDMIRGKEAVPFFVDKAEKKTNIKTMRKFHNSIKKYSYDKYANNVDWLLEIAGGRLGDLHKWINASVSNVVVTDIDREALQIGRERYDSLTSKPKTKVYELVANAKEDLKSILKTEKLAKDYNVVACQFGIHFFFENEKTLDQFIENVDNNLASKGYFIATALDGKQVFDLIEKNRMSTGQTLDLNTSGGNTVFSVKKLYNGKKFLGIGGEIAVYVESIGGVRNEYLVDFTILKNKFKKKGYKIVECTSFDKFYKGFLENNIEMTEVEKKYSFMNNLFVVQKK